MIGGGIEIKTPAKHVEADIDVILGRGFNSPPPPMNKAAHESVRPCLLS